MKLSVVIHGHFYQPPRENPWTGEVEAQPSAAPDHDWNARVARECYLPNGAARVADAQGRTVAVVNNYAFISFNFGPTLLSWYKRAHPEGYSKLLDADRDSARRLGGHGNAIAQAYNHMILPLANARDRRTQVAWGLEDFRRRFGRQAEALWLPETACDDETLRVLIDFGMRYVLLAPGQCARVRPDGVPAWTDASRGHFSTNRPYRWHDRLRPGKHIDLVFYDGFLSQGVAFGKFMADSRGAAEKIKTAFAEQNEPQVVTIATDGETYGHHEKFADMGLAHLVADCLPYRDMETVNFAWYLEKYPPTWEAEIKRGPQGLGTSWSCAHGVARWMDDCGCGSEPGKHQRWRYPLREALDWLRDELAVRAEAAGAKLTRDFWKTRDAYIRVVFDPDSVDGFCDEQLIMPGAENRRALTGLLESQKFAMYMYTSCGWFFADVAGLEAVQNLRYAARAVELAGAGDLEEEFCARLAFAESNDPNAPTAREVYLRYAKAASSSTGSARISPDAKM